MLQTELKSRSAAAYYINKCIVGLFWVLGLGVLFIVAWLLFMILKSGIGKVDWQFLTTLPSEIDAGGGIAPYIFNSFYVLLISLAFSVPIGIGAGIYMAEYAKENRFTAFLRICVEGLASVPSIVFGLIGIAIFVVYFNIGLTILGAGITLGFLNLPVLTRVTEEAMRTVSREVRDASYTLGAMKHHTIFRAVLSAALPGIITGVCLVAGRAFGETAVIILAGGVSTSGELMDYNALSPGGTLAVHLWYVQSEAIVPDAQEIAQKAAVVLLSIVLLINFLFRLPLWIRKRAMK